MKRAAIIASALVLSGCANSPPTESLVKSATVQVTSSDFCQIMRALFPTGKPSWSVEDTPETITSVRRLNAAYDRRCVPPRNPATSTS